MDLVDLDFVSYSLGDGVIIEEFGDAHARDYHDSVMEKVIFTCYDKDFGAFGVDRYFTEENSKFSDFCWVSSTVYARGLIKRVE